VPGKWKEPFTFPTLSKNFSNPEKKDAFLTGKELKLLAELDLGKSTAT
jgi:hypothetical protein